MKRTTRNLILALALLTLAGNGWALKSGDYDNSFDSDGFLFFGNTGYAHEAGDVAVDSQDRLVVVGFGMEDLAGGGTEYHPFVARFLSTGALDTTFYTVGYRYLGVPPPIGSMIKVAIGHDDEIYMGYTRLVDDGSQHTDVYVYHFANTGTIRGSMSFSYGTSSTYKNDYFADIAISASGKIAVAGSAHWGEFDTDFAVAVLEEDVEGYLYFDTSFNGTGIATCAFDHGANNEDTANAVAWEADGSLLVGGTAFQGDGSLSNGTNMAICRFSSTGALLSGSKWSTYSDLPTIADPREELHDLAVLADGKLLVAGGVVNLAGDWDLTLIRLNSDYSADTTFGPDPSSAWSIQGFSFFGTDTDDKLAEIVIEPSGGILVGATASTATHSAIGLLAHFNEDGTLDTSWGIGSAGYTFYAVDTAFNDKLAGLAMSPVDHTICFAGWSYESDDSTMYAQVTKVMSDIIHMDDFESGDMTHWTP